MAHNTLGKTLRLRRGERRNAMEAAVHAKRAAEQELVLRVRKSAPSFSVLRVGKLKDDGASQGSMFDFLTLVANDNPTRLTKDRHVRTLIWVPFVFL